jgi:hypothetical protein
VVNDQRLYLDYAKMADVCAIAKVTNAKHFSYCVHDLVERIWRVERAYTASKASDLTISAKRIAKAAHALDAALRAASAETKEAIRFSFSPRWEKSVDEFHTAVTRVAAAAGQVKRRKKPLVVRHFFLEQLMSDAEKSGGKLTLGENGSLIRVLHCLKPHLPSGFRTSLSTVKRIQGSKKKPNKQKE